MIWWSVKRQSEEKRTDKTGKKIIFLFLKQRRVEGSSFRSRTEAKSISLNDCGPSMRKLPT